MNVEISLSSLEQEQLLCNEALQSGAYDAISDKEWVELCERVASKGLGALEPASDLSGG